MASDPPHQGNINEVPAEPATDTTDPAKPKNKGGRPKGFSPKNKNKGAVTVAEVSATDPDKDEIEEAKFYLETLLFLPSEAFLQFDAPSEKLQLRMARLTAKLAIKYLGKHVSDEYKLAGLMLTWAAMQTVNRVIGGSSNGQRHNRGIRSETARQNPLDAA